MLVPPSGTIAGVYATTDSARGVWKAPAGTTATMAGVVSVGDTTMNDDVNAGIVNVYVGFAALESAEFVVLTVRLNAATPAAAS